MCLNDCQSFSWVESNAGYEVRGMDHVCHGHSEGFRNAYGLLELEVLLESWTQYILQEIVSLQGDSLLETIGQTLMIDDWWMMIGEWWLVIDDEWWMIMIRRGCDIKAELMSIGNKKQTTLIDLRDAGMALEIPSAFLRFQDLTLFIPTPLVAWWPFWAWIVRLRNGISWLESFTQLHSLGRWFFQRRDMQRHASLAECCIYKKKNLSWYTWYLYRLYRPGTKNSYPLSAQGVNLNFPFKRIAGHTGFFSTQV